MDVECYFQSTNLIMSLSLLKTLSDSVAIAKTWRILLQSSSWFDSCQSLQTHHFYSPFKLCILSVCRGEQTFTWTIVCAESTVLSHFCLVLPLIFLEFTYVTFPLECLFWSLLARSGTPGPWSSCISYLSCYSTGQHFANNEAKFDLTTATLWIY